VKHEHKVYPAPHAQLSLIVPRTIDIYIVEQKSTRRLRDIVHAWMFSPPTSTATALSIHRSLALAVALSCSLMVYIRDVPKCISRRTGNKGKV
jgi:hypothetical protein